MDNFRANADQPFETLMFFPDSWSVSVSNQKTLETESAVMKGLLKRNVTNW